MQIVDAAGRLGDLELLAAIVHRTALSGPPGYRAAHIALVKMYTRVG
jgi:hypothetical protein